MRKVLLASLFAAAFSVPAMAAWQFDNLTDEAGLAYSASVMDLDNAVMFEIYCDDWLPGMLDLVIYTGEEPDSEDASAPGKTMRVTADQSTLVDVTAFFENNDDEKLIVTTNLDIDNMDQLIKVLAEATQRIDIAYEGRHYRFPADNVFEALYELSQTCPE